MLDTAKNRAKKKNIEFSLTREDIIIPPICPVLGTEFIRKTVYTMSLDRIDSSLGYIKGNVQVISMKANAMKNNATPAELKTFADWIYAQY